MSDLSHCHALIEGVTHSLWLTPCRLHTMKLLIAGLPRQAAIAVEYFAIWLRLKIWEWQWTDVWL